MSFGVACLLAKETFTFCYLMPNFRPYFSLHDGGGIARPLAKENFAFGELKKFNFRPILI